MTAAVLLTARRHPKLNENTRNEYMTAGYTDRGHGRMKSKIKFVPLSIPGLMPDQGLSSWRYDFFLIGVVDSCASTEVSALSVDETKSFVGVMTRLYCVSGKKKKRKRKSTATTMAISY